MVNGVASSGDNCLRFVAFSMPRCGPCRDHVVVVVVVVVVDCDCWCWYVVAWSAET